jgi:glycosyltransferase involved in cell wall biosynthesis
MQLAIISPYTHLNGHYWPYTVDLLCALSAASEQCEVFAARSPRYQPAVSGAVPEWHSCCPWTRLLLTDSYRARNWGNRADTLVRNLEFHFCLKKCLQHTGGKIHIHCIESRHRILLQEVCRSTATFSSLCVGEPPEGMAREREEAYQKAFATGRLTFIVETESVRKSWEPLAGEHVVHIPAALPWAAHRPISQAEARKQLGLPLEATIFLFFGTHREGKDYRTAIEAAKVATSKPYLFFVGPLISGNDPEALATTLGYPNCLFRTGYFPDTGVPSVFDACDAVMLPYAENYQKGSAVLLQACHFGKPVIATASGHLREFVTENQTGLLYEPGSVSGLAERFDEVSSWKAASEAGAPWNFDLAQSRYSWATLSESYLRIFRPTR